MAKANEKSDSLLKKSADEVSPPVEKKWRALKMLPPGTVLKGVRLPRFRQGVLLGQVSATQLIIKSDQLVMGEAVKVEWTTESGDLAWATLPEAEYYLEQGLIRSKDGVIIQDPRFMARGAELILDISKRRGFLKGPAYTEFSKEDKKASPEPATNSQTSMKTNPNSLVLMATIGLAAALDAAPPEKLSEKEKVEHESWLQESIAKGRMTGEELQKSELQHQSIPKQNHARQEGRELIHLALEQDNQTRQSVDEFLGAIRVDLPSGEASKFASNDIKQVPRLVVPELDSSLPKIEVTCEDGMYFDAEGGVFVYMKNVRLREAQFSLDCDHQLKVFMGKKPEVVEKEPQPTRKKEQSDKSGTTMPEPQMNFGSIDRIAASGNVTIQMKNSKGQIMTATAPNVTYNATSGVILLSGGNQRVTDGKNALNVSGPGSYIKINKDGSMVSEGKKTQTSLTRPQP